MRTLGVLAILLLLECIVAYAMPVTPKRFCQCLPAPLAFVRRYHGDETSSPLPDSIGGHSVKLLVNGDEILPAMLAAIDSAEYRIRWLVMLFQPDEAGTQLAYALSAAARRGVRVQLAFDIGQTVYGPFTAPYSEKKM